MPAPTAHFIEEFGLDHDTDAATFDGNPFMLHAQPGIEVNGFGRRWRYAFGVVNGNAEEFNDNNSIVFKYGFTEKQYQHFYKGDKNVDCDDDIYEDADYNVIVIRSKDSNKDFNKEFEKTNGIFLDRKEELNFGKYAVGIGIHKLIDVSETTVKLTSN